MLKRLIEVALPLKEVSEQSAREKSIRHGHISTLHIWWARRPLAACRAVVFASLIPDPDDPECPDEFQKLVGEVLGRGEFTPKDSDGNPIDDTPRNRCLEFIKHLVRWENSNNPDYIEPARKLIAAAHKFLHPDAEGDAPKVLDPFAGGGAIPLEALRLGCEAHAIDLNPVAHLIELCTLVYPQKYGQPDSRPVPDYIRRLIARNRAKRKGTAKDRPLLDKAEGTVEVEDGEIIPDVEITEAEYQKNPLAADVKYWGHWVYKHAERELGSYYSSKSDKDMPIAFLWARTVKSPDPAVKATIPLVRQLWLCRKGSRRVALRMIPNEQEERCDFFVVEGSDIDFDPSEGTMKQGKVLCPFSHSVMSGDALRGESKAGRMGEQMIAVVTVQPGRQGKSYRAVTEEDIVLFENARQRLKELRERHGSDVIPSEKIPCNEPRRVSPPLYGLERFDQLFNDRQALTAFMFLSAIRSLPEVDGERTTAIRAYLSCCLAKIVDRNANLCMWQNTGEKIGHVFGRQALPMIWDYVESNPIGSASGNWKGAIGWTTQVIEHCTIKDSGFVRHGSADRLPFPDRSFSAILTDPPYYDSVPYSDLSDFFYVWHKRTLADSLDVFRTPLTPKAQEIVEQRPHRSIAKRKDAAFYEARMGDAFSEMCRVLPDDSVTAVMFAHKSTSAWETLIGGILRAGLQITASWPIRTEMSGRMVAMNTASLASSVTLIGRKRRGDAAKGLWDDVRQELKTVANERLDFFWDQGIRGADFFISAIGPALSIFGQYERVTKLSGDEVTVGQFLDEVRALVTGYALEKILHTSHTANIDPESRFYVVWKWSYADAKVPADESFKLAQALGIDTEMMWDKTGVLEKSGQNVQAMPVAKRMKIKNLGDPARTAHPAA